MRATSNLLFLCQDKIGTALAQPVATGRLDRVLQKKVALRTAVLLPGVRLEDSFVDFVPRHLVVTRARKDADGSICQQLAIDQYSLLSLATSAGI